MTTLTRAQFKEQLKDPEVANIKRWVCLLRRTIKPYGWSIVSQHKKKHKWFQLKITITPNPINDRISWEYAQFRKVDDKVRCMIKGIDHSTYIEYGNFISILLSYAKKSTA